MSKKNHEVIAFHMRLNAAVGMYADARAAKAVLLQVGEYDDEAYQQAVARVRGAAQTVSDLITAIKDFELP